MRITKYIVLGAVLAMLLPTVTFAHGDDHEGDDRRGDDRVFNLSINHDQDHLDRARIGTVTAVGSNSFTLKANDGKVYTVSTTNAQITGPFNNTVAFSTIKVNDKARVKGMVDATTTPGSLLIAATRVVITPANTHPAKVKGTVTAVNGSTITLQTKHDQTITVNTDSSTTVTKADGTTGTSSDVTVGSSVKVKGLWNMVLNVFNAIKIRLK